LRTRSWKTIPGRKFFAGAVPKNKKEEELLLPKEAQEKLNRCLLEVSMEWLKG
jgi:hypothetical protein